MINPDRRIKHICPVPDCGKELFYAQWVDGTNFNYACENKHTTTMTRNDLRAREHAIKFRRFDHKNIDKPDSEIGVDGWERWVK